MNIAPPAIRPVLVMDSVTWGPEYDPAHPLYDVGGWFRTAFEEAAPAYEPIPVAVQHSSQLPEDTSSFWPDWEEYSALVLAGSPSAAYDSDEWIARLKELIHEAAERSIPTLGICFGSQIIASTLGGEVQPNPRGWELGNHAVHLTPEGFQDPLFENFPETFEVMESHQDLVTILPPGAFLLATNDHSPVQAYGIGENIRAVQFHPELGPEHLNFILPPRQERIEKSTGIDVQEVMANLRPTPIALRIFRNFLEHFVIRRWAGTGGGSIQW